MSSLCLLGIAVYDVPGREVAVRVNEAGEPGSCMVWFDGSELASSEQLYRLTAERGVETRTMDVLR